MRAMAMIVQVETPWLTEINYNPPSEPPIRPTAPAPQGASTVAFEEELPTEWTLVPKL